MAAIALSLTEQVTISGKDAATVAVVQQFLKAIAKGDLIVTAPNEQAPA